LIGGSLISSFGFSVSTLISSYGFSVSTFLAGDASLNLYADSFSLFLEPDPPTF